MQSAGYRHTYWNGDAVVRECRAKGGSSSIHRALEAAERRKQEEQEKIDNFIPSFEFVGAEKSMSRTIRQLVTEKLFPEGQRA